jgi:hypothetical protein
VPLGEGGRLGLDVQLDPEARVFAAHLRPFAVEDDPELGALPGQAGELEPGDDPALGQALPGEVPADPRVEDDARVQVLGGQLHPALAPAPQSLHDVRQVPSGLGEPVAGPTPAGAGRRLDDADPLQLAEPGGEQRP